MVNPQYRLRLHPPAATSASAAKATGSIRVKVDVVVGRDMPVNAMIIWAKGERAFE
jgi:calpain-7